MLYHHAKNFPNIFQYGRPKDKVYDIIISEAADKLLTDLVTWAGRDIHHAECINVTAVHNVCCNGHQRGQSDHANYGRFVKKSYNCKFVVVTTSWAGGREI